MLCPLYMMSYSTTFLTMDENCALYEGFTLNSESNLRQGCFFLLILRRAVDLSKPWRCNYLPSFVQQPNYLLFCSVFHKHKEETCIDCNPTLFYISVLCPTYRTVISWISALQSCWHTDQRLNVLYLLASFFFSLHTEQTTLYHISL